jgi:hypothetical protein
MTPATRRRLTLCLVVAVLTLPVETVLLPVAWNPDPNAAAAAWVDGLAPAELRTAAYEIERYPAHYRRAMMSALTPDDRADAWRAQFDRYVETHPDLSADQRTVVREARALLTPGAFVPPLSPELRDRIDAMFKRTVEVLGEDGAKELFVTLGPADPGEANALPFRQRLADSVRNWRVASARRTDCNCNVEIDTCDIGPDPWLACSELYTCDFDLSWPMCGPLWSWACTGWCKIIDGPAGMEGQ